MTHLLIIKNGKGEEIARVPVTGGYSIQEAPLPKDKKDAPAAATDVGVGDKGAGKSKV